MARLIRLGNKENGSPIGWAIQGVPMPNGEKRDYIEYGRNAILVICKRLRNEKRKIREALAAVEA